MLNTHARPRCEVIDMFLLYKGFCIHYYNARIVAISRRYYPYISML